MIDRLIRAKIAKSSKSVLLLGPRQTGKSTLLKNLSPDVYVNLADEHEFLRHSSDAELLGSLITNTKTKTVFIDEIQRIPPMLNTIQGIVDDANPKNSIKFYLSGSSARKLRRGQANLLPGRIFTYSLGGLCAKELNYKVNLDHALRYGLLPEPYLENNKDNCEKLLESYSSTYLKEEIQAEALSRNLQGFARFLTTVAQCSGDILDFSKISTKSKVSRSSCVRFIEILEDTLIANRVPIFPDSVSADIIKHPKLYFFDVGVLNGLLRSFDSSAVRRGKLFEHFIYSQLCNSAYAHDQHQEIFFFRTRHGVEVDFILKLKERIWAIEVKTGDLSSQDLNGLRSFREYYPQVHKCIAVSTKERQREIDGIHICDWRALLVELGY